MAGKSTKTQRAADEAATTDVKTEQTPEEVTSTESVVASTPEPEKVSTKESNPVDNLVPVTRLTTSTDGAGPRKMNLPKA